MAQRQYLLTCVKLLVRMCLYLTKHRSRFVEVLGGSIGSQVDAAVSACQTLHDAIIAASSELGRPEDI